MKKGAGKLLRHLRGALPQTLLLTTACTLAALAVGAGAADASVVTPVAGPSAEGPSLGSVLVSRHGFRGRIGDWDHVRQVVDWLRYRKPPRHVVYLLGGSTSRESVTTEAGWSRSLSARLGKRVVAYVVSSSCQTFVEDARVVKALPKGRGVALITVSLSRFNMEHPPASVPGAAVRTSPPGAWWQHHYDARRPLSLAVKRHSVQKWRTDHLENFVPRYPDRLAELDALIQTCLDRGIRPVLVEMPLNVVAVRHDLDDVLTMYRQGCTDLAARYDIRYLDFVDKLDLRSNDFYDLWHLLRTGRAKWQNRLGRELVYKKLL